MQALDTRTLPRRERADAVITHLREIALASKVVLHDPDRVFMSTRVFELGEVQLVHLRRSGLFIEVSRERDDCAPMVAMMLGSKAHATREQFGHAIEQRAGAVDMVELNQPHRTWNHTSRNGWCLKVPADALALPAMTIRRARPALGSSPLHRVYASHLKALTTMASNLVADSAADQLGVATIALSRAVSAPLQGPTGTRGTPSTSPWCLGSRCSSVSTCATLSCDRRRSPRRTRSRSGCSTGSWPTRACSWSNGSSTSASRGRVASSPRSPGGAGASRRSPISGRSRRHRTSADDSTRSTASHPVIGSAATSEVWDAGTRLG